MNFKQFLMCFDDTINNIFKYWTCFLVSKYVFTCFDSVWSWKVEKTYKLIFWFNQPRNYYLSAYVHKTINQCQYLELLPKTWTFTWPTLGQNKRKMAKLGKIKLVAKTQLSAPWGRWYVKSNILKSISWKFRLVRNFFEDWAGFCPNLPD